MGQPIEEWLEPRWAFDIDCIHMKNDFGLPDGAAVPGGKGFLVIQADRPLDVVAVYTTKKNKGGGISIDVEYIKPKTRPAPPPPPPPGTVEFPMDMLNNSGQSGTAALVPMGAETKVIVNVSPGPSGNDPQPVHIHFGRYGTALRGIDISLDSVVAGFSETIVPVSLDSLMDGDHAINLHESVPAITKYTACGNIPVPPPPPVP